MRNILRGFYFITDHQLSVNGNVRDVELALEAGVKVVQFREKKRSRKQYNEELLTIQSLCGNYNAVFIINNEVELANELNADGVHVGQEDMSIKEVQAILGTDKIIGVSASGLNEAILAQQLGAAYIGVGHVFPTTTKNKHSPSIGIHKLQEIKNALSVPVAAIGGINRNNALDVITAGADMLCAISDSLKDGTVKDNVTEYWQLIDSRNC